MKHEKRWLGLFFVFALVLSLFIGATEVEAAKKKTKTKYLKAKKIEVNYRYDFKKPNYYAWEEGTTLLSYKKKNYVNVKEFSSLLSDTNLKFDVKAGKKEISFVLSKPFSDENYYRAELGDKKTVDTKLMNVSVKVGGKKFKIKVLQSFYYGESDIFFPLDFFEKNLGFSVRKQKNNLFIGEKVVPKAENYEVKLRSTGKSETVTSLRFADKIYLALKDLKRLAKGSPSSFGYFFDEKKGYINVSYTEKEKGSEDGFELPSKNEAKIKEISLYSGYYGSLKPETDYEKTRKPEANLPDRFVRTKALIVKEDIFLSLDFLCDFMNFNQETTEKEILFDDKKRENFRILSGTSGEENKESNYHERWGSPFYDALYEENGGLVSIQAVSKQEEKEAFVTVQRYSSDFKLQSEKKIAFEGEKFGAFFKGSIYNFILFGNNNSENSDAKVTYHLVKYDKEFNRLGSLEIRGAYTAIPFDAGTATMTESGDSLVIHTAKGRYDWHQSQMTFIVSISSMSLMNADDMGAFQKNHVGHSFDQRVEIDENQNVYLLDHGDAYPRSLALTKMAIENGRLVYRTGGRWGEKPFDLITFPGQIGANQTGFTLGSMVQGNRNLLIGGNHIDYSKAKSFDSYDIVGEDVDRRDTYLFVVNKENPSFVNKIRLTNYALDEKDITYSSPRVLKINEEKYLILWNKCVKKEWDSTASLCYQYVNQDGSFLTEKKEIEGLEMTKTEPILMDGKALWTKIVRTDYETEDTSKILFMLDVE